LINEPDKRLSGFFCFIFKEKTMESSIVQIDGEMLWVELGGGVQRKIMGYGTEAMMVKVRFEAGSIGSQHKHPHVQVSYVESGCFELTIGTEVRTIKKGDGFYVPSELLHGVVCMEPGILIDVFSPYREDFL
jgi:quercetin dioxygenase-like cupin family protein